MFKKRLANRALAVLMSMMLLGNDVLPAIASGEQDGGNETPAYEVTLEEDTASEDADDDAAADFTDDQETETAADLNDDEAPADEEQEADTSRDEDKPEEQDVSEGTDITDYITVNGEGEITKYTPGNQSIEHIIIPDTKDGVTIKKIGDSVFNGRIEIEDVTFPKNLETIGYQAFHGCSLGKVNGTGDLVIPSSVTSIQMMAFYECANLVSVTFEEGEGTVSMGKKDQHYYTFGKCPKLEKITLSDRVKVIPGSFAREDKKLSEVVWSSALTKIGENAFYGDTSLVSSDLSKTAVTEIDQAAFGGCSDLPVAVFPSTLDTIGFGAFLECFMGNGKETGKLLIPSSVTYIDGQAFNKCTKLGSVTFEEGSGTVSLGDKSLHLYTFGNCPNLEEIVLSARVRIIPSSFARFCPKLKYLTVSDKLASMGTCCFYVDKKTEINVTYESPNEVIEGYDWKADNRIFKKDDQIHVKSVSLDKTSVSINKGKKLTLTATVLPEDATNKSVEWSSSDAKVAKVDKKGVVTGVKEGSAVITVTTKDGGYTASCEVTINASGNEILEPDPDPVVDEELMDSALNSIPYIDAQTTELHLVKGQKFNMPAKGWASSDKKLLKVSKKGKVTVKGVTTDTPILLAKGNRTISVYISAPAYASNKPLKLEAGTSESVGFNSPDKTRKVFYTSSNPDVAVIGQDGNVTAIAKGSAQIITYVNGRAYKRNVKVSETSVAKARTLHISAGAKKTIKVKGLQKVEWNSSDAEIVTVEKKNKITAVKAGTAVLTTQVGEDTYTILVTVEDPLIQTEGITTVKANKYKAELKIADVKQISFKSLGFDEPLRQVVFKTSKPAVAYIDEDGQLIVLGQGKTKLSSKINGKTVTITVTVK